MSDFYRGDVMKTFIALLKGINVGGRNKLPMKELTTLLEGLGLYNVKTYIQSGNVVFQCETGDLDGLADVISTAVGEKYGFTPQILILSLDTFQQAITANPFPEGEANPKTLHLFFLATPAIQPNTERLEATRQERERFQLTETVFYLHAPDGIGQSKLAAKVEKALGVPVTARNWRSVSKIMSLAQTVAG
jgi:uncharacterized protein (DUF1697 family)